MAEKLLPGRWAYVLSGGLSLVGVLGVVLAFLGVVGFRLGLVLGLGLTVLGLVLFVECFIMRQSGSVGRGWKPNPPPLP